jgi:hypothetical protein
VPNNIRYEKILKELFLGHEDYFPAGTRTDQHRVGDAEMVSDDQQGASTWNILFTQQSISG